MKPSISRIPVRLVSGFAVRVRVSIRFVSGFMSGGYLGSRRVRVRVRIRLASGSCLVIVWVRVWICVWCVSGSRLGLCLVRVRLVSGFVFGFVCLVRVW